MAGAEAPFGAPRRGASPSKGPGPRLGASWLVLEGGGRVRGRFWSTPGGPGGAPFGPGGAARPGARPHPLGLLSPGRELPGLLGGGGLRGSYLPGEEGYRLPPPTEGEVEWLLQGAEALVGYRPRVASLWRGVRFRLSSFLFPVEGGSPSPGSAPRAFSTRLSSQRGLPKGFRLGACTRERSSREGPPGALGRTRPFSSTGGSPSSSGSWRALGGRRSASSWPTAPTWASASPSTPTSSRGRIASPASTPPSPTPASPGWRWRPRTFPSSPGAFGTSSTSRPAPPPTPWWRSTAPRATSSPSWPFTTRTACPRWSGRSGRGDFRLGRVVEALGATYVAAEEVVARFGERVYLNANRRADLP